MAASQKVRDAQRRPDVALVVDDIAAVDPWTPPGEIRGHEETHADGGVEIGVHLRAASPFDFAWIRIYPRRIVAWGMDSSSYAPSKRDSPQPPHDGSQGGQQKLP